MCDYHISLLTVLPAFILVPLVDFPHSSQEWCCHSPAENVYVSFVLRIRVQLNLQDPPLSAPDHLSNFFSKSLTVDTRATWFTTPSSHTWISVPRYVVRLPPALPICNPHHLSLRSYFPSFRKPSLVPLGWVRWSSKVLPRPIVLYYPFVLFFV